MPSSTVWRKAAISSDTRTQGRFRAYCKGCVIFSAIVPIFLSNEIKTNLKIFSNLLKKIWQTEDFVLFNLQTKHTNEIFYYIRFCWILKFEKRLFEVNNWALMIISNLFRFCLFSDLLPCSKWYLFWTCLQYVIDFFFNSIRWRRISQRTNIN